MTGASRGLPRLVPGYLRRYRRPVLWIVLLQTLQTAAALYVPNLNAAIIDHGVLAGDGAHVLRVGAVMVAVTALQVVCLAGAVRLGSRVAMAAARDLRRDVFERVLHFSRREIDRFGTPSLVTRTTNDVQQIQTLLLALLTLAVPAPLTAAAAGFLALREDPGLGELLLAVVPVLTLAMLVIIGRLRPVFAQVQERIDAVTTILREHIMGVRIVRASNRTAYEQQRFGGANDALTDAAVRAGRLTTLMFPLAATTVNLFSVPIVWLGAYRVRDGSLQVGELTAFLGYLTLVLGAVMTATFMFMTVPRAEVCARRIAEVLDTPSSLTPSPAPVRRLPQPGRVELRGVEFRHPGAQDAVLRDVDLVVVPGRITAVIGSIGSGKSTLLGLIARLADPTAGRVMVGGVDVRDLAPDVLARAVGLVPQQAHLFSGSVAANLRLGRPDASDAELWRALEVAQARDFVDDLGGLQAELAPGGDALSGGQRQRLAIARTLVQRPLTYLFDDCFSALDAVTETRLRAALPAAVDGASVIVVANRVSTIVDADSIVVLDAGRMVGAGRHRELAAGNAVYREILASQGMAEVHP